ncbi:MAG: ergothioneine biosynthesis protein EgtB [Gammaproteobacteria bacterium]|nr:ergothioneine biosynthesis protein EgtB [Gammaproteobacteria bacterium]
MEPNSADSDCLTNRFGVVRQQSEDLCLPLGTEDFCIQPMDDASPPKWHLAHTSWFFETFLLKPYLPDYQPFHPRYEYLFNSYYNAVGSVFPRNRRGLLSRPTVAEVFEYRRHVNDGILVLLAGVDADQRDEVLQRLELGVNHEQQHQELMLTDLKYNLGHNPLFPAYRDDLPDCEPSCVGSLTFTEFAGGTITAGADEAGFRFDNEMPRHDVLLQPYVLADRLITNAEYRQFMEDGGYSNPQLWLSDGWAWLKSQQHSGLNQACATDDEIQDLPEGGPLYWRRQGSEYVEYQLSGLKPVEPATPVTHISFYEADAYARWAGRRLPREYEWEHAVAERPTLGNFVESERLHPAPAGSESGPLAQLFGDTWEWTASPYCAYPGYRPLPGALGEYNGKFMSNQLVLRGGSCATPGNHVRATYRNFFYPSDRWQFTGIRLACDQ